MQLLTSNFPSSQVNWKVLIGFVEVFSLTMVFALVRAVSSLNAKAFSVHLLIFILVDILADIKSTTSAPPLVWS